MMICLIDADIIVNRAGFGAETRMKKEVNGQVITTREVTSLDDAIESVDAQLANINRKYPDSSFIPLLSGRDSFRRRVSTEYKANRDPSDKPLLIDDLKEYISTLGAIELPYVEADDGMSILQYHALSLVDDPMDSRSVICTIDKDLNCVPGHHYDFIKDVDYWVDHSTAHHWYHTQLLTGDSGDNIKGIKGIGPKKAQRALEGCEDSPSDMYHTVVSMYQEHYKSDWENEFKTNSLLLGMLFLYTRVPTLSELEQEELNEIFERIISENF